MKSLAIAFLLTLTMPISALGQSSKSTQALLTPVIVTNFQKQGVVAFIEGNVRGASSSSRLVLFLRFANQPGLHVAADQTGNPELPRILGNLPPQSYEGRGATATKWKAMFFVPNSVRVEEIFVVACEVRQQSNSTPELDYKNFQYLPFRQADNIDDALLLLREFAWLPTGFTRIAP